MPCCAQMYKAKQDMFKMSYDLPQLFIHSWDTQNSIPEHDTCKGVYVECLPGGQHCTGVGRIRNLVLNCNMQ